VARCVAVVAVEVEVGPVAVGVTRRRPGHAEHGHVLGQTRDHVGRVGPVVGLLADAAAGDDVAVDDGRRGGEDDLCRTLRRRD
jgi:hypothetical protein